MTNLRFHQRHIHKTVANYVEVGLTSLGWVNPPINFGTTPLSFMETQPEDEGVEVKENTVAISVGNEQVDMLEELGGGLYSVRLPLFFDVFTERSSLSVSVASDIKDLVTRGKAIYVKDWTDPANPVQVSELLYFEDVVGPEKPEVASVSTNFRRHWRIVKAMAKVYYGPSALFVTPSGSPGLSPFLLMGTGIGTSWPTI